jgi:DNA repair protein RecO (recombination protein O)
MALLVTDAIVLHVADYLESSRILRLATREAGVLSVVARGARNSKRRFGSAVGLFAIGQAQVDIRPSRDMHTLTGFDVTHTQPGLAADLARFSGAAALAECALRMVHDESAPQVYDGLLEAFRTVEQCEPSMATTATLGALWRLVRDVGFSPTLESCAECHDPIADDVDCTFSHAAGGALCVRCGRRSPGGRRLPASARASIAGWLRNETAELSHMDCRAHQRLLREFLGQHMSDHRPPRAYVSWEDSTLHGAAQEHT